MRFCTMSNLNENAIREAAYYIWKNNGCPSGTSMQDWNSAIQQLSSNYNYSNNNSFSLNFAKSSSKTSSCKTVSLKKCSKTSSATKKTTSTVKKTNSKKSK